MEGSTATGARTAPVSGYSRAELDEFLGEAASERARLEAAIVADEERARRARSALGAHRVMVAMLLSAQRELDDIRIRAEREAAAILGGADRPAPMLDLTRIESPEPMGEPPCAGVSTVPVDGESNDYFDFLRGALDDDAPLGPRPESA
jgi:hypothetical protein